MTVSIAQALPNHSNVETPDLRDLVPQYLREDAETFVKLMEDYYTYLNDTAAPSNLIAEFTNQHDIEQTSDAFLNSIQAEIAAYIPRAAQVDQRRMYQLLAKYFYNNRGSRESAETFFRIFYDSYAEISDLTDGSLIAEQGELNWGLKQNAWLPYSYVIKTDVPIAVWEKAYKEIIHPAGFRFFALLLFVIISYNKWSLPYEHPDSQTFTYRSGTLDWFYPGEPGDWAPYDQPGLIGDRARRLLFVLYGYLEQPEDQPVSTVILTNLLQSFGSHPQRTMDDYLGWTKFLDPSPIAYYKDFVIEDAIAGYYPSNPAILQNIGTFVEFGELIVGSWPLLWSFSDAPGDEVHIDITLSGPEDGDDRMSFNDTDIVQLTENTNLIHTY